MIKKRVRIGQTEDYLAGFDVPSQGGVGLSEAVTLTDPETGGAVAVRDTPADPADLGMVVRIASQPCEAVGAIVSVVLATVDTVTLLPANNGRRGLILHNDATGILYVKLGSGAAPGSYSFLLWQGTTLELAWPYHGVVTGFWESAAAGRVMITELAG